MQPDEREQLIAQYTDGYRAVAEALLKITPEELDATPGARQVVGARDRPSPRRQRDDGGGALPPAAGRGQAGDQGLRPGSVRRPPPLRSPARGVAGAVPRRPRLDRRVDGLPDRGRMAARRHAQRGRAASASTPGCASTPRTRTATPIRSAWPAARPSRNRRASHRIYRRSSGETLELLISVLLFRQVRTLVEQVLLPQLPERRLVARPVGGD